MNTKRYTQIGALAALVLVILVSGLASSAAMPQTQGSIASGAGPQPMAPSGAVPVGTGSSQGSISTSAGTSHHPIVGRDAKHDLSQPLRDMRPMPPPKAKQEAPENPHIGNKIKGTPAGKDPVVQNWFGALAMPTPLINFNGMGNLCGGCLPPDTNGDVGPNHYVQMTNLSLQMFNKSGASVYGPVGINTLWSSFGGPCETSNSGDPIVVYDPMADRWLISQFTSAFPYGECVAISQTPNPTGAYYRYYFVLGNHDLGIFYDYPKFGVWPDGYYMSANLFQSAQYWGTGALVFDRARMLQGLSASYQEFDQYDPQSSTTGAWLPSDLDGATKPPVGAPNYFVRSLWQGLNTLSLYKFHVDWTTPANSTFTGSDIPVAYYGSYAFISQPGTTVDLDPLADKLMFRLAYRNFGDHESLVVNQTTGIDNYGLAGIRWYEIRSPNSSPFVYQQGTYAPDQNSRWMGSIAMDRAGNMALGYSVSSSSVYPSIRYTGRLAGDPLGTMPQGETTLVAGGGSQTYNDPTRSSRWGDYSDMTVDPVDDCTFWYTQEYYATTSTAGWQTRIGAFKFPSCGQPTPTSTPTITPGGPTLTPTQCVVNAIVNGDFETGSLSPWAVVSATPAPVVTTAQPHTGAYSMLVGGTTPVNGGDSSVVQTFTVPTVGATLSFWYWPYCGNDSGWQTVYLEDPTGQTIYAILLNGCSNTQTWTNLTYDLSAFAGQTVRVRFWVRGYISAPTYMYVDDVSVRNPFCPPATPTITPTPTITQSGSDKKDRDKIK